MSRRYRAIGLAASTLLAVLVMTVALRGGNPFGLDSAVHDWVLDNRTALGNDVLELVTASGAGITAGVLAAIAGALIARRRWWLGALIGVAALIAGQYLRLGIALALDRSRPPLSDMVTHTSGPAMPSGHTSTSAMVAIAVAAALLPYCHSVGTRVLAVAIPGAWGVSVGLSRVYLGMHWPTDVLAGWLYAIAITSLVLPLLARPPWGRDRDVRRIAPLTPSPIIDR